MDELPRDRIQVAKSFRSSGIDYAGLIQIRALKGINYAA